MVSRRKVGIPYAHPDPGGAHAPVRQRAVWLLVPALVLLWSPGPAFSQVVGLALSGGSARGLAHIGVIQVLEAEGIPVDVVTGTSMGALIGSLYALGHPADSLEAVARRFNEGNLFSDRVSRRFLSPDQRRFGERTVVSLPLGPEGIRLPEGALEGARLMRALERELWLGQGIGDFRNLPRSFRALAVDLRTGHPAVLDSGSLARAVRASIAIPGLLEPVAQDSLLLVDGGLVRNLPALDARELGAQLVICSDVSRPLEAEEYESLVEVVARGMMLTTAEDEAAEREACDILLRPVSLDLTAADYEALPTWLEIGRAAATAALPELRDLVAERADAEPGGRSVGLRPRGNGPIPLPDTVRLQTIRFRGLEGEAMARSAQRALGIRPGDPVYAERMEAAMSALQATGLFRRITYEIHPSPPTYELEVFLEAAPREEVGVGVRYDDRYQASLLFTASLLNRLGYGASTRVDLRLGEEFQLQATHFTGRGITSSQGTGFSLGATRGLLELNAGETSRADVWSSQLGVGALLTVAERAGGVASLELRQEWVWEELDGDAGVPVVDRSYRTLTLMGIRDTFDDAAFPRVGAYLLVRAEVADRDAGSGASFWQHLADVRVALALGSRLSLRGELFGGAASGPDLPLHKHFFLGGTVTSAVFRMAQPRLVGLPPQDQYGRVAQAARLALQWEFREAWYLTGILNAGDTRDEWDLVLEEWTPGWGAELGTRTFLGPVRVTLAGRDTLATLRLDLELGRRF